MITRQDGARKNRSITKRVFGALLISDNGDQNADGLTITETLGGLPYWEGGPVEDKDIRKRIQEIIALKLE